MSLSTLLNIWRDTPGIAGNIAAWRTFPTQPGQFAPFPADLHPDLAKALQAGELELDAGHSRPGGKGVRHRSQTFALRQSGGQDIRVHQVLNRFPAIRLKIAAEKLQAGQDNVSQIAYQVGFNSLSYFTKCFKEQFGVIPSAYGEKNPSR